MSNPAVPSINTTQASLTAGSRRRKRNNRMMNVVIVLLVFVGLLGLSLTVSLCIKELQNNKIEAEQEKQQAFALQNLPVTRAIVDNEHLNLEQNQDNHMTILTLLSKPEGADVYFDGFYVGTTPINGKKLMKSNEEVQVVMIKDQYEIARHTITLTEDTDSHHVDLVKIEQIAPTPSSKPVVQEGVVANKAVVINTQDKPKTQKKNMEEDKTKVEK